jgi:hypothetical protein
MRPLALALALLLLVAGCSSASSTTTAPSPRPAPATRSAASLGCAFYTPVGTGGGVVNVSAQGPACGGSMLAWLVSDSDRRWITEAVIPGDYGTQIAMLAKGRSTVQVWTSGVPVSPVGSTAQATTPQAALAGRIADALQAAGWRPV